MNRLLGAAAILAAASVSQGAIVITEIFYNPNGSEGPEQEWIEIYNSGATTVDLSGWDYGDSQDNSYTGDFPAGTTLAPGAAAIIVAQSSAIIEQIWGPGIQVITTDVGISLGNTGTARNETVVIRDAADNIVDAVNYETGTNGWPGNGGNRASIYLLPTAISQSANDIGSNWAVSSPGIDGAWEALDYNPDIANAVAFDIASPGYVEVSAVPEPASLAMVGLAGLLALRRRRV